MRRTPSGASARSFTSCRFVVAIQSSPVAGSGGEQALVLAAKPRGEGDVGELDAVPPPQLRERPKLVQLEEAVDAIAACAAGRDDEAGLFQIPEHPRRPPGPRPRVAYRHTLHGAYLNTSLSRCGRALAPVAVLEPDNVVEVRRRDLQDRRVLERRHAMHGARPEAES